MWVARFGMYMQTSLTILMLNVRGRIKGDSRVSGLPTLSNAVSCEVIPGGKTGLEGKIKSSVSDTLFVLDIR